MSGMFRVGLSYENIQMDRLQFRTDPVDAGQIATDHDELETLNQRTVLSADYGLSSRLSLNLMVPYIVRDHTHLSHHSGGSELEQWSFSGLGDVMVHSSYVLLQPVEPADLYLGVAAGIKVPTGATIKMNESGEEAEVTIQPGTGSTDGVLMFNSRYVIGSVRSLDGMYTTVPVTANVTARINGRGKDDYRMGNEFVGSLGSSLDLSESLRFLMQLNIRLMGHSNTGTTGEERSNTGGTWTYLTPGIGWNLISNIDFFAYAQVPLYQNVNGIQQVAGVSVQAGVSVDARPF